MTQKVNCVDHKMVLSKLQNGARILATWRSVSDMQPFNFVHTLNKSR